MASTETPSASDPAPPAPTSASENAEKDVDPAKLEALVTEEQVHSANVARKRRTITKKRPSSTMKPRDQTPVRTATDKETTDEDDVTVTAENGSVSTATPNAPERKQRRKSREVSKAEEKEIISKEEKNEQNVKCMSEISGSGNTQEIKDVKDDVVAVAEGKEVEAETTRDKSNDHTENILFVKENAETKQSEENIETKLKKDETKSEIKVEQDVATKEKEVAEIEPTQLPESDPVPIRRTKAEKRLSGTDTDEKQTPKPEIVKPARRIKDNVIKTKIVPNTDNAEEEEVIIVKKAVKGAPQSEVFALLKQAKRATVNKAKARLKKSDLAKRSLSTPREKTTTDEELIESFKMAQLSALQKDLHLDPTSSDEERPPPTHLSRRSLGKRALESKRDEDTPSEISTTEDVEVKDIENVPRRKRIITSIRTMRSQWKEFKKANQREIEKILKERSKCFSELIAMMIFCGLGGIIFKFTEGAFENFYKCGVKRVKRDFIDSLWTNSHNLQEDRWKSLARTKLRMFEEELHVAHEAGMTSYSGQRSWSFLNGVVYALTIVTTIGYGHMYPTTKTGQALTIVYAIIGIPLFLIVLTDFGKLFTRCIKFLWAFVRRVYYTGSCKKVRRTAPVQDFFKGAQMMYEIATFRRPSQWDPSAMENGQHPSHPGTRPPTVQGSTPTTPAPSNYAIDDEFNLPISVALLILIIYIFSGAVIYWIWERWGFFDSFYFVFISMSTIGFGDFVPKHPICMIVSIVYLVFGLALMSMCINVVQVKLSDTFRQASAKIGATIGLRVAEEDGTITPIPPPTVEVAEVHTTANSK